MALFFNRSKCHTDMYRTLFDRVKKELPSSIYFFEFSAVGEWLAEVSSFKESHYIIVIDSEKPSWLDAEEEIFAQASLVHLPISFQVT